jgi:hypothetical protein
MIIFSGCREDDDPFPSGKVITVKDNGSGTGTVTWKTGDTIILEGLVFVNDGSILTIEPGVVIKGKPGQEGAASALIVSRGAKIFAEGTALNPIIFTAFDDQLNGNLGNQDRGLWGGVIILGNARLNSFPGESNIEGIPIGEPRGIYGGNNDNDDSGTLKYVSIRHGGTDIGLGNEINGLTLGGVGSKSTIEFIEIFANKDDGLEIFGGTVRCRYIVSAYCGDDQFDTDEGYRGYGQFWFAVTDETGESCAEHDGGTNPVTAFPYAIPNIYNVTYIGNQIVAEKPVMSFNDNAGGNYANSIFITGKKGISFELKAGNNYTRVQDCVQQITEGNLSIRNSIFWTDGVFAQENLLFLTTPFDSVFLDSSNQQIPAWSAGLFNYLNVNQDLFQLNNYFDFWQNQFFNPGITVGQPLLNQSGGLLSIIPDSWFIETNFKGAFGSVNWAEGWTRLFE